MSRSERLGNVAQNYALDDDLASTTIGLAGHGEDVLRASYLLFCATMDVDPVAPPFGLDPTILENAHRFGVSLRTVALADELVSSERAEP
jgi:hypothetical protein